MDVLRRPALLLLGIALLAATLQGVQGETEKDGPSESQCRPYIEKALKELETGDQETKADATVTTDDDSEHPVGDEPEISETPNASSNEQDEDQQGSVESSEQAEQPQQEESAEDNVEKQESDTAEASSAETGEQNAPGSSEERKPQEDESAEKADEGGETTESIESAEQVKEETAEQNDSAEMQQDAPALEEQEQEQESAEKQESGEQTKESAEEVAKDGTSEETKKQQASGEDTAENVEQPEDKSQESAEQNTKEQESVEQQEQLAVETEQGSSETVEAESGEKQEGGDTTAESDQESAEVPQEKIEDTQQDSAETAEVVEPKSDSAETEEAKDDDSDEVKDKADGESVEKEKSKESDESVEEAEVSRQKREVLQADADGKSSEEDDAKSETAEVADENDDKKSEADAESSEEKGDSKEEPSKQEAGEEAATKAGDANNGSESTSDDKTDSDEKSDEEVAQDNEASDETLPEEELINEIDIPADLRPRDHVNELLKLDAESSERERLISKVSDITLKELKRLYENAIKPLEIVYKYRDLSNRHFGDSEIFSKPLVLFMGPWSGGKSSIINYLTDNEYTPDSLRTGAEPSPAYFNIVMWGEEPEVLDGTQLAADFTFAGLQKFGQGLEERLRGQRLPNKLLEKINIVEIPGILEVRKQVSRVFPFNDACQWFIDRADIIFLIYDPSKLDVGPETEAILDQLKGREHQTRIILNKADQVKPEELMRVQGALIWNISPLMSSAQPPVMYTTSLWSRPYEIWAPTRLLQAQERAFLRDLRTAVDKRIENKIASARRFAVRVRNHAKMVDCYLTTYYNHKSVFGNRKLVADSIIEHPQDYHIYEGLSTLTNISRYDLPDPDVYRDFFRLNPLYDFQQLAATCTYFRGCPINRLDVAIAYDLPELVGKHRKLVEAALADATPAS